MELVSVSRVCPALGQKGQLGHISDIASSTGLFLPPTRPLLPWPWSTQLKRSSLTTTCKQNGRKLKSSSGKGTEAKRKEFESRKAIVRKSKGSVPVANRNCGNNEEESMAPVPFVLGSGDGAISVAVLQPLDEEYHPMENLSKSSRSRGIAPIPASPAIANLRPDQQIALEEPHLRNSNGAASGEGFSQGLRFHEKKQSAGEGISEGFRVREKKQSGLNSGFSSLGFPTLDEEQGDMSVRVDDEQDLSLGEEDYEEWEEVGIDEDDDGQVGDEDEEDVDYWEGDLPPMSAEEEEELLREAAMELAELQKLNGGGREPRSDLAVDWEREDGRGDLESEEFASDQRWTDGSAAASSVQNKSNVGNLAGEMTGWNGGESADEGRDRDDGSEEIRIETRRVDLESRRRSLYYWDADEEDEEGDGEGKGSRGIPAVMRCFDRAKVYVKSGDGGNGVVAFRREKFVPFGGPYGGNGGRGGHVFVEVDSAMNSLLPFRKMVHFRGGRGAHGGGKRKEGAGGVDCTVKVPSGTVIREAGPEGKVLLELTTVGQREMLLPGGFGGRGNAAFKSGRNSAPQLAELGETGAEMWVELELKLVADVGIVGVPNAGKSTLLSAISAAKPEIANYPFTTLLPNLGVVALGFDATMVVADLPGLLEGAHNGTGLGHEFLRHTERCKVLVHVVDGMSPQPVEEFEAVRLELELFNALLAEKPCVVAFNKMDVPEAVERWEAFQRNLRSKGIEPFCMSAATQQGTTEVISAAHGLLMTQKELSVQEAPSEVKRKVVPVAAMVRKQRSEPIENFAIEVDKHTRTWQVVGAGLERFTQMTNWEYFESVRRFQRVLGASGVTAALRERGIREGDTVIVAQMEFNWMDSEDMSALIDWKRGTRGTKVWPH